MHEVKDTVRATVRVGFDGRVHKTFRGTNADERYHHEMRILKFLEKRGCDCVPRVLEHDDASLKLVLSHCGQAVESLPQERLDELFTEVERYGVKHTDQACRNITYDSRRGRFCVIDFELAQFVVNGSEAGASWTTLAWSGTSDIGRRRARNDDTLVCFSANESGFTIMPEEGSAEIEQSDLIFIVSDGMGGAKSGDLASSMIAGRMREMIPQCFRQAASGIYPDRLGLLEQCLEDVHRKINKLSEQRPHLEGMGATVTLGWFTPESLYFIHVGDTRLYLYRGGSLQQQTEDHTRAWQEFHEGRINERQFRGHPRRHCLQQVIGGSVPRIVPQMGAISIRPNDWFLICSDGLIGGLWDKEIERGFQSAAADSSPEPIMRQFLRDSLEVDGSDNVTLAVISAR